MKGHVMAALVALMTLAGCGADDLYSSDYACRFVLHTQYHPGTAIETALQGYGTYAMVSAGKRGGVWHVYATLNDGRGETEDITLSTDRENYLDYSQIGAANGIILGQTNFNGLVAYDRQCSNCLRQYGGTSYPLEWSTTDRQQVTCGRCGRHYQLETGTVVEGEEGIGLFRYRVSYAGTGSVLTVTN